MLPLTAPRLAAPGRALGVLGALLLLPALEARGAWPLVLLAGAASALGTPTALALAAGGAALVALRLDAAPGLAALVAALAAATAADAFDSSRRARSTEAAAATPVVAAGAGLALMLTLGDGGAVLAWTIGVGADDARVTCPAGGVLLGLALLAALAGVLLFAAGRLGGVSVEPTWLAALGAAAALTALGTAFALARAAALAGTRPRAGAALLGGLFTVAGLLGASVLEARRRLASDTARLETRTRVAGHATAALAALAAAAAGIDGWLRVGTYLTPTVAAAVAAAVVALAALEPTRCVLLRRLAVLAALIPLVVGAVGGGL